MSIFSLLCIKLQKVPGKVDFSTMVPLWRSCNLGLRVWSWAEPGNFYYYINIWIFSVEFKATKGA